MLIQKSNKQDMETEEDAIIQILAQYFVEMLTYVYSGQRINLENTKEIINDLMVLAGINEEPALGWIFKLLKVINKGYEDASLWNTINL